ncbi:hypothetical protein EDC01DRAFT_22636 [Geopyxis carbonaria]|nr:hypothetical protein EDC01DRAFT_22636 [Geopyxis carbonaria]
MASPTTSTVATPAETTQGGSSNSGPTSSPLLFFVALGFGVVFTNLWIIVGVKYCFRYNARQRARANGEEEAVDLQAMPRPHRRRREKKLMSLEEVNERFPATKYKTWRSHREAAGLPTEGGIRTEPNSRANSVRDLEIVPSSPTIADKPTTANSHDAPSMSTIPVLATAKETGASASDIQSAHNDDTAFSIKEKRLSEVSDMQHQKEKVHDEDEEEDHVQSALPEDLLKSVGDSCAICLDVIEEDDDVRGLTCGHAFHAACLDPWLTHRRACCPLCKKDYYIPKPRPEGEAAYANEHGPRDRTRRPPGNVGNSSAWFGSPGRLFGRGNARTRPVPRPTQPRNQDSEQPSGRSWIRNPLTNISLPRPAILRRNRQTDAASAPADVETGRGAGSQSTPATQPA